VENVNEIQCSLDNLKFGVRAIAVLNRVSKTIKLSKREVKAAS